MKMTKIAWVVGMLACFRVSTFAGESLARTAAAVSPDGKNEVRLETGEGGMSYSVWRNGKALVEPTRISLVTQEHGRMDGAKATPVVTQRTVAGTVATPLYKKSAVDLAANERRPISRRTLSDRQVRFRLTRRRLALGRVPSPPPMWAVSRRRARAR